MKRKLSDIVKNDEAVALPDLKNKNMVESKEFSHFYEYEGKIFSSLPFGIMVINPEKLEISDTYYIGPEGSELKINQLYNFSSETGTFRDRFEIYFDENHAPIAKLFAPSAWKLNPIRSKKIPVSPHLPIYHQQAT